MDERDPEGGGALAARALELAARLVADVARRSGPEWDEAAGAAAQAEALARRAIRLGESNAVLYRAALAALEGVLPSDRPETRDYLLGSAVARAARTPLAIAECAADAATFAVYVADHAPGAAAADAIAAAAVAAGAARAAAHLVEVNLATVDGDERLAAARRAVRRAEEALRNTL